MIFVYFPTTDLKYNNLCNYSVNLGLTILSSFFVYLSLIYSLKKKQMWFNFNTQEKTALSGQTGVWVILLITCMMTSLTEVK